MYWKIVLKCYMSVECISMDGIRNLQQWSLLCWIAYEMLITWWQDENWFETYQSKWNCFNFYSKNDVTSQIRSRLFSYKIIIYFGMLMIYNQFFFNNFNNYRMYYVISETNTRHITVWYKHFQYHHIDTFFFYNQHFRCWTHSTANRII